MMRDYISRDEIFSVWRSMPKPASISSLTEAINRTPAADVEPVRRWIPCSERMPKVCKKTSYFAYIPRFGAVDIADYHPDVDGWTVNGLPITVTHWMPLPEPPEEVLP